MNERKKKLKDLRKEIELGWEAENSSMTMSEIYPAPVQKSYTIPFSVCLNMNQV